MKLTDWFDGNVTPHRVGIYQRHHGENSSAPIRYSYWNGRHWGGWAELKRAALSNRDIPSSAQRIPWRGIARRSSTAGASKG